MTDTDEKISFDSSKERLVQATENTRQHAAEGSQDETVPEDQQELASEQPEPAPRKTLLGMAIQLPKPDFVTPSATPDNSPQPLKPLRLPALRKKLAFMESESELQFLSPPTSSPALEPISKVGYDDSFAGEPSDRADDLDEILDVIPEIQVEEVLDDNLDIIPEVKIEEILDENLDENLDLIPEVQIEEKLEENLAFISEIIPLDDSTSIANEEDAEDAEQEALATLEVSRADQEDFDDEATQIGAGLYDFPEKYGASTSDVFDDEHTQISEGLNFEDDRKSAYPEVVPEAGHPEIAVVEVVAAASAVAHDDDFADEKTELYDSPFENDPICPKLTVLSGPAIGMEFFVNKMRNTIGRGTNNTIVVPDSSMSRQHFEINQSLDESFVIRDLQAVNGTFLNGTRIVEADLFHGDRIEAGKTVIQFLIGSTAPQVSKNRRLIAASVPGQDHLHTGGPQATYSAVPVVAQAAPRDPGRLATYVALGCAVLCIPLVALVIFVTPANSDPAAAPAPARIASGQTASQTYLAGVEAVKKREWLRARALFMQTAELEPNFNGIPAQLTRIDHELAALKLLDDAQADIERKQNDRALAKIRSISQNSVYFDDAQRLLRQIRQKEVFSIFDDARANFDKGDLTRASELISELLEIVPEHGEGIELKARIEQLQKEEQRRQQAAARAAAPRPSPSGVNTIDWASSANDKNEPSARQKSDTANAPRTGTPAINFTEGFTHYRARDFNKAIQHFENIAASSSGAVGQRAEKTVSNIRRFESSYHSGQAAFQKSNWAEAARHLQEAHRADLAVGGASGYFSREISDKIAQAFGEMGMDALKTKQYQRAFTSLQRGDSHSAQNATLQQLSRELINHATTLYEQANQLKTSDPRQAASHCRTILTIVNPNTPVYKNAKKLLDTL